MQIIPAAPGSYAVRITGQVGRLDPSDPVKQLLSDGMDGIELIPVVTWTFSGERAWPCAAAGMIDTRTILGVFQLNQGSADIYRLFGELKKINRPRAVAA